MQQPEWIVINGGIKTRRPEISLTGSKYENPSPDAESSPNSAQNSFEIAKLGLDRVVEDANYAQQFIKAYKRIDGHKKEPNHKLGILTQSFELPPGLIIV